jgi:two-component system sensor histidine kinase HupT/HoxJ
LDDFAPLIEGTLEGAARVSEIVRNLRRLSFSKTGDRGSVDLEKIIRTACQWASRSKKTVAEIVLDLEAGVMIDAHEGQIHQVAVNMFDNALDAVRGVDHPKITVTLRKTDRDAIVVVSDNGPGISPEAFDKIFEPFFTTKVVGEGTGLGLWISYTIIQEHSGSITATNNPDGGACFTVSLPLYG